MNNHRDFDNRTPSGRQCWGRVLIRLTEVQCDLAQFGLMFDGDSPTLGQWYAWLIVFPYKDAGL